jgi:hypothetical protein
MKSTQAEGNPFGLLVFMPFQQLFAHQLELAEHHPVMSLPRA